MKVVQICTHEGGGAGTAAARLQYGLKSKGINVKTLCMYPKGQSSEVVVAKERSPSLTWRIANKFGVRILTNREKALTKLKEANGDYDFYSLPYSEYELEKHPIVRDADIIHLHWVSDFLNFPSFFLNVKKPVIWTLHDLNPLMGGFHYNDDYVRNRANAKMMSLENHLKTIKKNALHKSNIEICTPSKWLCQISSSSDMMKSFSHHHVPNGLDIRIFHSQDKQSCRRYFNLPLDKKIILFVSEIIENRRKGFRELQLAVNEMTNKENFIVVAVGKAGPGTEAENFIFVSNVHDEKLMAMMYAAADVCVLASKEDNLPNVMIESLCCGTPVVAFPIGGIPETIQEGINGKLSKEVTPASLAEALEESIYSTVFDTDNISKIAAARYDYNHQAANYLGIYSRALENKVRH